MTTQAINSLALYKGNDPAKIKMLLQIQKSSVVKELMEHFGASDTDELAIRLSLGKRG